MSIILCMYVCIYVCMSTWECLYVCIVIYYYCMYVYMFKVFSLFLYGIFVCIAIYQSSHVYKLGISFCTCMHIYVVGTRFTILEISISRLFWFATCRPGFPASSRCVPTTTGAGASCRRSRTRSPPEKTWPPHPMRRGG